MNAIDDVGPVRVLVTGGSRFIGWHVVGQVLVGMVITGITAYLSVRFLVRYFETRTLTPFAIYCLIAGGASILRFAV